MIHGIKRKTVYQHDWNQTPKSDIRFMLYN